MNILVDVIEEINSSQFDNRVKSYKLKDTLLILRLSGNFSEEDFKVVNNLLASFPVTWKITYMLNDTTVLEIEKQNT
jgi:hypothetical protein